MQSRTFKIGEACQGGVITVEIIGKVVSIIAKEWDTSVGYSLMSDQSGAKEFKRGTILSTQEDAFYQILDFLTDLTTDYHADVIMEWIQSKTQI